MSQAYSGVQSNVLAGATDVDSSGWSLDYEVNTFDSTTTADLGWDDETSATQKISGSVDFFYNPAKKPTGGLGMNPGSTPILTLYVNKTQGDNFSGLGLIKKLSLKTKTKDGFVITASYVNKGPWTVPS